MNGHGCWAQHECCQKGIIGSVVNLDRGLGEFLVGKSLSRSLGLSAINIGVVGTP
jgi:hypothetical protein